MTDSWMKFKDLKPNADAAAPARGIPAASVQKGASALFWRL
jgi:hypothetical protein